MIKPETISVIIPTYNPNPDFLERTLKSIDQQTVQPKDVIVVENGKEGEKTQEIVEDDFGFDYIWNSKAGANLARNTGADIAEGDVLFFTDDDCILEKDCLEQHLKIHKQHLCLLGGKVSLWFLKEPPIWMCDIFEHMLAKLDLSTSYVDDVIIDITADENKYLVSANMSIQKMVFDKIGGFDVTDGYVEKKILAPNDEFELINKCRFNKVKVLFSSRPKLDHIIPEFRLTEEHMLDRFYGQGLADCKTALKRDFSSIYPPVDPNDIETLITNTILKHKMFGGEIQHTYNLNKDKKDKLQIREITRVYTLCLSRYYEAIIDFIEARS
jgi:glycosyltransferase involved in cell wall biosynthesis